MERHAIDCPFHVDQVPWECLCGASYDRKTRMNRFALYLADLLIRFVGQGNHSSGFAKRVRAARLSINELRN